MADLRWATPDEFADIERRLADAGHLWGIIDPVQTAFLVAEVGDMRVGFVGMEEGAEAVLLRSLFVEPDARLEGVGRDLVAAIESVARERGFQEIAVFSTDAGPYWLSLGYVEVPVPEVVAVTRGAPQTEWAASQPEVIAAEVTYAKRFAENENGAG